MPAPARAASVISTARSRKNRRSSFLVLVLALVSVFMFLSFPGSVLQVDHLGPPRVGDAFAPQVQHGEQSGELLAIDTITRRCAHPPRPAARPPARARPPPPPRGRGRGLCRPPPPPGGAQQKTPRAPGPGGGPARRVMV